MSGLLGYKILLKGRVWIKLGSLGGIANYEHEWPLNILNAW